jgi:hypothetical protein
MTMTSFINVSHITANARRAIAKKFAVNLDWHKVNGRKVHVLSIPGRMTGGELVREVEAAVRAAE